jgi:1-acyl-sn-glycerol-3-phosphate acyltransferase
MGIFNRNATPRKSWLARYREYAENCTTSGFIPTEHLGFQRFVKVMSRLWTWIQVGEVRVVGRENLTAAGRLMYCPNHSAMLDAIVLYPLMPLGTRFMSAREEMRGMGGLKAILMGAAGAYPVDRSRGRTVIPASIDLLVKGKRVTLFPEGKISPTGEYLEFKKGAAWIAIGACDALGHKEKVGIVPIHICYGTRDVESATDFTKMRLRWRHGVTITIGEPVYVHDVDPMTPANVIDRIKDVITGQACETTSLADEDDTH